MIIRQIMTKLKVFPADGHCEDDQSERWRRAQR